MKHKILRYNYKTVKKLSFLLLLTCLFAFIVPPPLYIANNNSGFGGAVGYSSLSIEDEGGLIGLSLNSLSRGITPEDFNDVFVMYIDTGAPGRSAIDATVDDDADGLRKAISNSNSDGFGSTITFPTGFEVTHAIAIDTNFGGLWSIPNSGTVGTNGLNFITSVNSTLTSNTQTSFSFSFNWTDLGLTHSDGFKFVGLYVSHTAFNSDEGYGVGITVGTQGADDVKYTSYEIYGNVLGLEDNNLNSFTAHFTNGNLNINGLNDLVNIKVYDIYGRLVHQSKHQINGSLSLPITLLKKQLQFIVIESTSARKILKVIPQ
jgi:hypothetical protein